MNKFLKALFLIVCAGLLAYGVGWERHDVRSLATDQPKSLSGLQYVEGTTTDDYFRKAGALYDTRSLSPQSASQKDCKT